MSCKIYSLIETKKLRSVRPTFPVILIVYIFLCHLTYLCHTSCHFVQIILNQSYTCKCCQHFWFWSHERVFSPEFLWHLGFSLTVSFSFDTIKEKEHFDYKERGMMKKMKGREGYVLTDNICPIGRNSVSCWLIQWICSTALPFSCNVTQSDTRGRVHSEQLTVKYIKKYTFHKHFNVLTLTLLWF